MRLRGLRVSVVHRLRLAGAGLLVVAGLALALPAQIADIVLYAGNARQAAAIDPLQAHYQAAEGDLAGFRRAAAIGDPDPETYVALGDAEARAGRPAAATAAYRQALARYPYDTAARQRLRSAPAGAATASRTAASG